MRVAALGHVRQIRLEVFDDVGNSVYNPGFKAGNVFDWGLEDAEGKSLPDGTYLCVVTFADASGKVWTKQGTVLVQSGHPSLKLAEGEQADAGQDEVRGAAVNEESGALMLTAHDGGDGQLVSTRGSLSFRAGDFFAGKEKELMRLTPEGDLGLGVSAPQAKLDVAGTIRARGGIQFDDGTLLTSARGAALNMDLSSSKTPLTNSSSAAAIGGTGTANRLSKWVDGSGTLGDSAVTEIGGKIGIGTSAPNYEFTLMGNDVGLQMITPATGATATDGFRLGINSTGQPFFWNQEASDLYFGTNKTERMRITGAGNVGIGTTSPSQKLEVVGNMHVTGNAVVDGNIAAKYQDVAEWVQSSDPIAAGTVVTLDQRRSNAVRPSARPYDTHVAGVVSAQPGVILGEGGDGKVMVATTGRVKVKVDAKGRPIRVGDLLVTSSRAGVAMRSLPIRAGRVRLHRPGTIIGKALEPLAKGKGEILVLLSLQ